MKAAFRPPQMAQEGGLSASVVDELYANGVSTKEKPVSAADTELTPL